MTLNDIKGLPLFQTAAIAEAAKDPETQKYIVTCLQRLFSGDYGDIPTEDTEANNNDLDAGNGRILARYKAAEKLAGDIYIIAAFYAGEPDNLDANNIMILYCDEY